MLITFHSHCVGIPVGVNVRFPHQEVASILLNDTSSQRNRKHILSVKAVSADNLLIL